MLAPLIDRQALRKIASMQVAEKISCQGIALGDRALGVDHAFLAEILEDEHARIEIPPENFRRRVTELGEPLRHGDERLGSLGELGNGAVGAPVAQWGAVRPWRRDHQDRSLALAPQTLIGSRRGIALDELTFRLV